MSDFDKLMIRCPRLGGEVTFAYCRQEQGALPCGRTLICWQARFPVDEYLRGIMSADDWDHCFTRPPKDKLSQILEIAEEAKKRKKTE
jgi:hypothetical protein